MIFDTSQIDSFLQTIDTFKVVRDRKKLYYNLPMSFDIETSSFYEDKNGIIYTNEQYKKLNRNTGRKKAIMYIWQFAICDNVIYGRTWNDFLYFIRKLHSYLDLDNNYIIVYIHNLSYEFQFMCKWFKWFNVFADSERKPIKAETENHIIFKCSYRLSGYSLAVVADNLQTHKIKKLVVTT